MTRIGIVGLGEFEQRDVTAFRVLGSYFVGDANDRSCPGN